MIIDSFTAEVFSIDDPDAHNQISIEINNYKDEPVILDMNEALAASIAAQIANVLQDRAHTRASNATEAVYHHAYNKRKELQ